MISRMRVYLGSDHAGFELKAHLLSHLPTLGYDVTDCGAHTYDAQDDYPPYCIDAATRTVGDPGSLGVVIGGSGNGEQIAANKVRGIRAALAWNDETARLAREHNNAQIISLGAQGPSDRGRRALRGDLPGDPVLRGSPAHPADRHACPLRGATAPSERLAQLVRVRFPQVSDWHRNAAPGRDLGLIVSSGS